VASFTEFLEIVIHADAKGAVAGLGAVGKEAGIADPKIGESTPAAPIAWDGLVFIGNAGGDNKGV